MATRLKRHVGRSAASERTRRDERLDLGMSVAEAAMPALADDAVFAAITQPTIGFGSTSPSPRRASSRARAM